MSPAGGDVAGRWHAGPFGIKEFFTERGVVPAPGQPAAPGADMPDTAAPGCRGPLAAANIGKRPGNLGSRHRFGRQGGRRTLAWTHFRDREAACRFTWMSTPSTAASPL